MKLLKNSLAALRWRSDCRCAGQRRRLSLDHFPTEKLTDQGALQNGAKLFVNYCLNCHGASSMRYNRLTDLGLTERADQEEPACSPARRSATR